MATTVINSGFGYFYWMFAARLFNADEVGRASAVIAAMNLTALVANMGLPTALIGLLPKQKSVEDRVSLVTSSFAVAVAMCLVLGTAVGLGLPHFAPTLRSVLTLPVVAVFTMGVVLSVLSVISDSIAIARRQAEGLLMRNVTFTLFKLVMLLPAAKLTLNGERFLLSNWVLSLAIGFGFISAIVFPKFYGDTRPARHSLLSTARATVPSALGHHFANLGGQLPMFLLPLFVISRASDAASAHFYITWMVGSIFFMVSNATSNTLFAEGSHAPDEIVAQLRSGSHDRIDSRSGHARGSPSRTVRAWSLRSRLRHCWLSAPSSSCCLRYLTPSRMCGLLAGGCSIGWPKSPSSACRCRSLR
ncbi:MAG: hypothetical protein R2706_13400 [Acidimicrobiales bacterium]